METIGNCRPSSKQGTEQKVIIYPGLHYTGSQLNELLTVTGRKTCYRKCMKIEYTGSLKGMETSK